MDASEQKYFNELGITCKSIIAQGGYVVVFLVYDNQYKTEFALKKIPEARYNKVEVEIMASIDHPNTINLYKTFQHDGYVYMLMEYCPNDLMKVLKSAHVLDSFSVLKYCYDIAIAIKACHERNIAHSDIKPSNFLIDKYGRIKVCDFGLSNVYSDSQSSSIFHGTYYFMAPEVFRQKKYNPLKADIWALGVTFFYIVTKTYPFISNDREVMQNIIDAGVFPAYKVRNLKLRALIAKCFAFYPEKRPCIHEIIENPVFEPIRTNKLTKVTGNSHSVDIIKPFSKTGRPPVGARTVCLVSKKKPIKLTPVIN